LGANKVPPSIAAVVLAERLAEEATAEEESNPWGDDDLMDVNADEGDWSAYRQSFISSDADNQTQVLLRQRHRRSRYQR